MRSTGLLARFRRFMTERDRAMNRSGMACCVLSGALAGVSLSVMMPAAAALQSGSPQWGLDFPAWMAVLAAIALSSCTLSFFGTKLGYTAGLGFMRNMQVLVGNKVSRLPLGWFGAKSAGRLSRMVTQEMLSTGQAVAYFIGGLAKSSSAALVFCLGGWLWSWQLGLVLTAAIPAVFLLLKLAQACIGRCSAIESPAEQELASRVVEFAQCQAALRACHAGSDYRELRDGFDSCYRAGHRGLWWGVLGNAISGMSVQLVLVAMVTLVCRLGLTGTAGPLESVVMIGCSLRFATLLNDIGPAVFGMEERRQMLDALDEVMDAPEMDMPEQSRQPQDSSVELEGVDFSYVRGTQVLSGISLKAPARSMLAIVGPSGCGKTTIVKLVARFYDACAGSVRVGGVDVRELGCEELFRQVSFVFQDVYLFNDSLRNNVLIARPQASEEELERAAELAGVSEIVQRLPEGWDTACGEGGRALSGGERQRVSIARALLKQAPIVLFDEATSALDAENEANITRSMAALRQRSTLVVVAHKLETIKMADQIVVLNASGRVVERGSHEELLAAGGSYRDFWNKRCASARWRLA